MTFATTEESEYAGEPVQLFEFRYGEDEGAVFLYTDCEDPLEVSGKRYKPIPVSRANIVSNGTFDKTTMEVRLSGETDIGLLYKGYPPAFVVTLTVYTGHLNDMNFIVVWSGIVRGGGPAGREIVLTCEPISASMKRNGLRRCYQYGCPLVLYGLQCNADKTYATVEAVVASLTSQTVTLTAGWNGAFDVSKFIAGTVEWTNDSGNLEIRTVNKVNGDVLSLKGVTRGLHVGQTMRAILGCNHQESDCVDLHKEKITGVPNIVNFGGDPWIPTDNPTGKSQN